MNKESLVLLCFALTSGLAMPQSFALPQILDQLPVNKVTELDGQVYVRVVDQRRGILQPLEKLLITRATAMASHWLCDFSPKPNLRLEANLQGVSLIHSRESDTKVMDVVIRLKKQKPDCIVKTIAPSSSTAPSSAASDGISASAAQGKSGESVQIQPTAEDSVKEPGVRSVPNQASESGIKTKINSTEY